MKLTPFDKVVKDGTYWLTLLSLVLCAVILGMVFAGKHYTVVKSTERKCSDMFGVNVCFTTSHPTLPKLGLILVSMSAPLFFVINSGLIFNFFFDEKMAPPILVLVYSSIGVFTFFLVSALAFTYHKNLSDVEIVVVVLYAITAIALLLNAVLAILKIK